VAAGQSQRFYSGVGIFNWYASSDPTGTAVPPRNKKTKMLLLNPDLFFFWRAINSTGPAQKVVLVLFFGEDFLAFFYLPRYKCLFFWGKFYGSARAFF
jgi:hypothetical protein